MLWWLPLLVLGTLACRPQREVPVPAPTPELTFSEPTPYAGSAACKPCHAAEFESHQKTFHAATLREATLADLGLLAPAAGEVPGGGRFTVESGRLVAHAAGSSLPLQLALGSGKTGMTFMAILEHTSAEIRQSYFPREKKWYLTPGVEKASASLGSAIHKEEVTRQCLGCHAVTLPLLTLMPERRFFGVGCESCHGPGGEHVTALQKGEKPKGLGMMSLRGATGTQINALCGRCHRTEADITVEARKMTNRFQPYGLSLSRCFKESGNVLTCITCHNPHENVGRDPKPYEAVCLSCHTAPKKACPVNPKAQCISCHMPDRPVMQHGSAIRLQMADHFICVPHSP